MLPKVFGALLMGRGANEIRRRQRPIPGFTIPKGARHESEGYFVAQDEPGPPEAPIVLTPLPDEVAASLAAEARALMSR